LELEKLTDEQIHQVLSRRAPAKVVERIVRSPQLLDLARRPVMLELLLEALPDIEAGKPVDLSRVYLYAIRRKMERDIKDARTFTSMADKLYFMCEISWEMLATDQMSINYRQFPDRVRELFGPIVQQDRDLDHWRYDMMGQTLLTRSADGDYAPAHRSLAEFFVAYKLAAELGVLSPDFTELAKARSEVEGPPVPQTWSAYFHRHMDPQGRVKSAPRLDVFVPQELRELTQTVGRQPMNDGVRKLMGNMLSLDASDRLLSIALTARSKTIEEVGYVAANALTVLTRFQPAALAGKNLSQLPLATAFLRGADLSNCNLEGSNLRKASLVGTRLSSASLKHCDLTAASFMDPGWTTGLTVDTVFSIGIYYKEFLTSTPPFEIEDNEIVVALLERNRVQSTVRIKSAAIIAEDMSLISKLILHIVTVEGACLAIDFNTGTATAVESSPILLFLDADFKNAKGISDEIAYFIKLLGGRSVSYSKDAPEMLIPGSRRS
jgi:uncharacterized protein YjbI with pentapeptide repeats